VLERPKDIYFPKEAQNPVRFEPRDSALWSQQPDPMLCGPLSSPTLLTADSGQRLIYRVANQDDGNGDGGFVEEIRAQRDDRFDRRPVLLPLICTMMF
jgi:hypothetical protein